MTYQIVKEVQPDTFTDVQGLTWVGTDIDVLSAYLAQLQSNDPKQKAYGAYYIGA